MRASPLIILVAGAVLLLVVRNTEKGDDVGETVKDVFYGLRARISTPYDDIIRESAAQNGIEYSVLWNLLYMESRFRPDIIEGRVTSPVGALGIAQFMPATAAEWGVNPLEPMSAIPGAARYLSWLIRKTGSVDAGVAAYNWGIGNVQRKGLRAAPPETVKYVAGVTGTDILA